MFGAGCFWGVEAAFLKVPGVKDVTSGYSGGAVDNPDYRMVCTGTTGHAEVVEVEFDPDKVSYDQLLDVFFDIHDPTTVNRQGFDIGTQYRSAVFFHTPAQEAAATAKIQALEAEGRFHDPIVTEVAPASPFYRAEDYHQRYYEKKGYRI